jgi:hypothetical protein
MKANVAKPKAKESQAKEREKMERRAFPTREMLQSHINID